MGLMESIHKIIEMLISIQNQLSDMISFFDHEIEFTESMIDLSAIDVASLETNVKLLASYKEDIDYIIDTLSKLSGNIQVLFWMILCFCGFVIGFFTFLIFREIFKNKTIIRDFIKGVLKKWNILK